MATSQRGKIQIELSRTLTDYTAMTDSGDQQYFTLGTLWSGKSGSAPDVRPNGIVTGSNVVTTHASNDTVTIAAFTAYSKGALQSVSATTATVSRPATTGYYKIVSVTMASDGSIATVDGTTNNTGFSTTRAATGGPPLIAEESVELAWIRLDDDTAAVITASEILQAPGESAEYAANPGYDIFNVGSGSNAATSAQTNAHVKFNTALPTSHTGSIPKAVYLKYYTPSFTTLSKTVDFKPAETGISKSSETMYEGSGVSGAIGAMKADSVGDVSFVVFAEDGVTDSILAEKNDTITVKFFPDSNKAPYILSQGLLGVDRDFSPSEQNKINVTVYCEKASADFAS